MLAGFSGSPGLDVNFVLTAAGLASRDPVCGSKPAGMSSPMV